MHRLRTLVSSLPGRAALLFVLLMLPWPGLTAFYGGIVAELANATVGSSWPVRLECSAARPDNSGSPWDLHVRAKDSQTGRLLEVAVDLRRSGYMSSALFLALALSSPLRRRKKIALVTLGLGLLLALPLLPILAFFSGELPIVAFHVSAPVRWTLAILYRSLVAPPAMAYAVPALLWLLLVWALEPRVLRGRGGGGHTPESRPRLAGARVTHTISRR